MAELKSCPFCGTSVLFEKDAFYNIYQGTCEGCTMQFRYEEKEEEITDDFIRRCGEIRITRTMPQKRRLNLPFEQAWNTRTKEWKDNYLKPMTKIDLFKEIPLLTCPLCGGEADFVSGRMIECKDCGAKFEVENISANIELKGESVNGTY